MILRGIALILVILIGVLLLQVLVPGGAEVEAASRREYLSEGPEATGAINIVSAIYLGYRAYDTMGEAIVLLLAVTGVSFFAGREHS
jgi:multisubunit Na+/H+ antiporter MnhB subunit